MSLIDRRRHVLQAVLFLASAVALAIALWDLTAGGFYFRVFGLRISSWEAYKPFRIGMLAFVAALWMHDRHAPHDLTAWHRIQRAAPWIAAFAAIAALGVAIRFGIRAAGGADAYGYVSQAYLWASGQLIAPNPLAHVTAAVGPAVAPLGYRLATDPAWLVPIYAPGLPLLMAVALTLAGQPAIYLVVPLLTALTVWFTYVLGRRLADARIATLASLLVATSPIMLFQSFQPMSDVPVTACWMAAWVAATSPRRWSPVAAGLAVSAALVVRPNLLPLAVVIAWLVIRKEPRWQRLAIFGAAVVPGCALIAIVNLRLNGSPLQSGYGALDTLYAWNRLGENLRQYTTWLVDLHSPAILLALVAPLFVRMKALPSMLVFTALLLLCYVFYFVFDSWPFLRFLLPAIPLLCLMMSGVLVAAIGRIPIAVRGAVFVLVCTLLPGWYLVTARTITAFSAHRAEQRYATVAGTVAQSLEPNAVVLTVLHSGSIRLYSGRMTVRWDLIEPDNLDFTLKALREGGYVPYLVLDDWEEPAFRARFTRACAAVTDRPIATFTDVNTTRLYAFTSSGTPAESRTSPPCGSAKS